MKNYVAGVVIPVYITEFIANTVEYIKNTADEDKYVFCIVNDGVPAVKEHLDKMTLPSNFHVINLPRNLCFSGCNNAGFRFLLEKYPSLKYLGSLNDDTIPKNNWLDEMILTLESDKNVAAVAPQLKGINAEGEEIHTASIFYYGPQCQMLCDVRYIEKDAYVNLFGGCCFLCKVEPFLQVGLLDEEFKNGAEDMDLCIKFLSLGYRLMISSKAHVVHFGGKSRLSKPNQGAEICHSVDHLFKKWGEDLRRFNNM